jgi:hypothetical protein
MRHAVAEKLEIIWLELWKDRVIGPIYLEKSRTAVVL